MKNELIRLAAEAKRHAYAPYSGYAVGAAILAEDGRTYTGCNVENISFGATICAERGAVAAMVAGGSKRWSAIAVVTRDDGTPCGICRQVLAELAVDGARVYCADDVGHVKSFTIRDLLPSEFESAAVRRDE